MYLGVVTMSERSITEMGNPAKPHGSAGFEMLTRMNDSRYEVTGWALEKFTFSGSERVLDIGCGGGATLHRMAEKITSGHLTGVDYSPVSVELSSKNNSDDIASGKMNVVEASVESLPFTDNSFDRIITVESFYFWPDPQENLREVYRVLDKGGVFLIVADVYGDAELSEESLEGIRKYSLYNPTRAEFRELLENAGFTDVTIHTKDGTSWICAEGRK